MAARRTPSDCQRKHAVPNKDTSRIFYKAWIVLSLIVTTFAVYGQVATHNFVLYDDTIYVQDNPAVLAGLTPAAITWAFSTLSMNNWHPLTWLSYMLDIQLFGLNPGAMLLENAALHGINAIVLFLLLHRLTGFIRRSAIVAALFALHPLHVESVAWISERKDVLSTLFWFLTLYFHTRFAEQRSLRFYFLTLGAFSLGLLTKPMLVTLPLIMLLMDYWPLQRFAAFDPSGPRQHTKPFLLLMEKVPFFALATGSCMITVIAQQDAMAPLVVSSYAHRISNSLDSYILYLGKMVWPSSLAPFYPFSSSIPLWQPLCSALALSGITLLVFRERNRHPYLIFGWLWYLITLIPVIGIVRVGMQAMADRYTYIPLTGIFIMLVWGISDFWHRRFSDQKPLFVITFLILTSCSFLTWRQASLWKDSTTLFTHTRMVTSKNYIASNILGIEQMKKGNHEEALKLFDESFREAPWFIEPYINQGLALHNLGRLEEAAYHFKQSLIYSPLLPATHNNLGITLAELGRLDEAIEHFREALRLKPDLVETQKNLKQALELKIAIKRIPLNESINL